MKTFATPSKPLSAQTPSRRALRERNETFVSGSNMLIKDSIASVNDNNIFDNADVASSTLKSEQIVSPTYYLPIRSFRKCKVGVVKIIFKDGWMSIIHKILKFPQFWPVGWQRKKCGINIL